VADFRTYQNIHFSPRFRVLYDLGNYSEGVMKRLLEISFLFLLFSFAVNAQWIQQNSGTTATLHSVKAVDNNIIWATGDYGLVLNTTDGGTTWNIKTPTQTSYDNFGITAFDINTAIVIGSIWPTRTYAKIWKTTDSGNTCWAPENRR